MRGGRAAGAEGGRDGEAGKAQTEQDGQPDHGQDAGQPGGRIQSEQDGHAHHDRCLQPQNQRAGQDRAEQQGRAADRRELQLVEVAALDVAHQVLGGNAGAGKGRADDGKRQNEPEVGIAAQPGDEAGRLAERGLVDHEEEDADDQRRQKGCRCTENGQQVAPGEQPDLAQQSGTGRGNAAGGSLLVGCLSRHDCS